MDFTQKNTICDIINYLLSIKCLALLVKLSFRKKKEEQISAAPGVLRLDKFSLHQEGDSPSLQEIFPRLMLCKAGHFPRQAVPEAGGDGG